MLLLNENINPNIKNNDGTTALDQAIDHIEIIKLLLSNKDINSNVKNKYGYPALHSIKSILK